jgi:hypothetical protein
MVFGRIVGIRQLLFDVEESLSALTRRAVLRRGSGIARGSHDSGIDRAGQGCDCTGFGETRRFRPLDFSPCMSALDALDEARIAEIDRLVVGAMLLDVQAAPASSDVTSEELTLYFLNMENGPGPGACDERSDTGGVRCSQIGELAAIRG